MPNYKTVELPQTPTAERPTAKRPEITTRYDKLEELLGEYRLVAKKDKEEEAPQKGSERRNYLTLLPNGESRPFSESLTYKQNSQGSKG